MTRTTPAGFVDGTNRIGRLLADPERAKRVAKIRAAGREMDRAYALNLSMIRKAADLTQDELAEKLGIRQGDVSKLEHRGDVLLSSLLNYLTATGAEDARIVVTVRGQEIELDLANLGHLRAATPSPELSAGPSPRATRLARSKPSAEPVTSGRPQKTPGRRPNAKQAT